MFLKPTESAPKHTSAANAYMWDRVAVASIVAGAVIRVVWGLVIHPPFDFLYSDMGAYVERAQRLAQGGPLWRIDAFNPPGTHMLLALPIKLFGTGSTGLWAGAVLWCVLSSLIPLLAWRLARLLLSPAAAALAAAFCAFWPLNITYGAFFTSETPSLALMVAALWSGYRAAQERGRLALGLGLLAGVLAGAAIGCRPQWILNLVVLAAPLALRFRREAAVLAGLIIGTAGVLGAVVAHNTIVAGKLTGLSENSGVNFWMGHCDVRTVTTNDPRQNIFFTFSLPAEMQLGRGGIYTFEDHLAWDQSFFYGLGMQCIRQDGLGHVDDLVRNVMNMTATTIPWPQVDGESGQRTVVQASNLAYSLLLPWILIESIFLIRRRRAAGQPSGELIMLLQLACVALVAIVYFGDPRLRAPYDVFGLSLLAALIADRLGLDGRRAPDLRRGQGHPQANTPARVGRGPDPA